MDLGIVTIMDLDDYWSPSKDHPAYQMIVNDDLPHKIRENIKKVNYVTTTTPIFADEIKKLNKKCFSITQRYRPRRKTIYLKTRKNNQITKNWVVRWFITLKRFGDYRWWCE